MPLGEHDPLNALLMGDEPEHASLLCCRSRGVRLQQTCLETVRQQNECRNVGTLDLPPDPGVRVLVTGCFALDAGNGSERPHPVA
jgi:hypothetical protein